MRCPRCEREYDDLFSFCPYCGRRATPDSDVEVKVERPYEGPPEAEEEAEVKAFHNIGWVPVLAIAIAVISVVGWVLAGVFIGTGPSGDEADTESIAEKWIEAVNDEDYNEIYSLVDTSSNPLLGILISEAAKRGAEDIQIIEPDIDIEDSELATSFIQSFIPMIRKDLQEGNVKSLDSRKLEAGKHYVVAIFSFDSDQAFPLMEIKSKDGWSVDLTSILAMMARGTTSRYVIDSVEALLQDPTRKRCDKAIEILEASGDLSSKYELWLQPQAESLLPSDVSSGIAEGNRQTEQFEDLLAQANELREKVASNGEPTDGTEPEPAPATPEITTITGEGPTVTQPLNVEEGLIVFRYDCPGTGSFALGLLNQAGEEIERLADMRAPGGGSQAVGLSAGNYFLNVETSGPWTVSIEEPAPVSAPIPPVSFAGDGPAATDFFQTRGGSNTAKINYTGEGQLVIKIMELGGNTVDLLIDTEGPYGGSQVFSLQRDIFYLLNVEADGPWAVEISL